MTTVSIDRLAGEKLNGQFRVSGVLRTEANRVILSAEADETFDAPGGVAVIVDLSPEPEENYKRFLEARFLDHPHIARALASDWLELEGQPHPYIVVPRPDAVLSDLFQNGPFSGPMLTDLMSQVLTALAYLHSENLVYGALNLNSIWRVGERWQLADFSQLRVPGVRPAVETRRLLINREIAAPPEAYYGEITSAWDIWSLGTLLSKIARPVRKAGSDKQPNLVPLSAKLESILKNASILEPDNRMTAAGMLRLLSETSEQSEAPERLPQPLSIAERPVERRMEESPVTRRFSRVRLLPVIGIAAGAFALSLFITRSAVDSDQSSSKTPAVVSQPSSPTETVSRTPAPVVSTQRQSRDETKLAIAAVLGRWANAVREGDLGNQVNSYGPVVDTYFDRRNLTAAELRRDKERALALSGPIVRFDVSNLRFDDIGPDWAVVSFDNHWAFGGDNPAEGSAKQQVVLRNLGGDWKITSERDAIAKAPLKRSR